MTIMFPPRLPLNEFVQDAALLAALRKGVRVMQARMPSDPLSWFYQAAIHGVTDSAVARATAIDPNVQNVDQKRFWNQCPHNNQNSANFLPWHRGYTYYFEKILRMHTEHDGFSLPYWDYEPRSLRKFPREFGIEHLDGNFDNNDAENINSLYFADRDFYFTGYEHPLTDKIPYFELSDDAVDWSPTRNSEVFFGETETEGIGGGIGDDSPGTRGLMESYPHDPIHRTVGGIIGEKAGAMAVPATAAFDPIFCVHHSNIDRLWVEWACMPGKRWGKLPSAAWFEENAWFFFDSDGMEVLHPRKYYFDHRTLGVRFKYEDGAIRPLTLPDEFPPSPIVTKAKVRSRAAVPGMLRATAMFPEAVVIGPSITELPGFNPTELKGNERFLLRLRNVDLRSSRATGFDVHLTREPVSTLNRSSPSFLGSVGLFAHVPVKNTSGVHDGHHSEGHGGHVGHGGSEIHPAGHADQTFDVTRALVAAMGERITDLKVVLMPFSLVTSRTGERLLDTNHISIDSLEIIAVAPADE